MNNSIIKLISTLVAFFIIAFVDSNSTDDRAPSTEGIIIGPDTPVYYVGYSRGDNSTYYRVLNKFEGTPSYYDYRNPKYNFSDTVFVKILVVYDWDNRTEISEQDILNDVLTKWNKVDEYFGQLDNPKIKLAISGVVIPTKSDILGITTTEWSEKNNSEVIHNYHYPYALNNLTKWLNDNSDHFENLNYDVPMFMSRWTMSLYMDRPGTIWSAFTPLLTCKPKHGTDRRSVGATVSNNNKFAIYAAYTIGRLLHVQSDEILGCRGRYVMRHYDPNMNATWSSCSRAMFRRNNNNNKYSCLHQIPYGQYEDDYSLFRKEF